jgi:RimJ/RimL family protein N-acetyltransferase
MSAAEDGTGEGRPHESGRGKPSDVRLRGVRRTDLDVFYHQQADEVANRMAAFAADDPLDRVAFDAHWDRIFSLEDVRNQTILWGEKVAGYIAKFELFGQPSIAYWLGREYWGQGIATEALRQFLRQVPERPLFARVVADNLGSIRVLEKAGFVRVGAEKGFASARKAEVDELIFRIDGDRPSSSGSARRNATPPE